MRRSTATAPTTVACFSEEVDAYLDELKKQIDNLRILLASVEAELSERQERRSLTDTTQAWLLSLGRRLEEVEEDTPEVFEKRKQLVGLLVAEVTIGKKPEDGRTEVRITYRFGPPPASGSAGSPSQGGLFVSGLKNGRGSITPDTNTPTLTVVAVR